MRKTVSVFAAVILSLLSFISAFASDTVMYTEKLSAPLNRLFDVPIYIKSEKTLSAASFNIKYDSKKTAFRNALCDIENSKVKFKDENGFVKVIFLCESGVNLKKKSKLLYLRFKSIDTSSTAVTIAADDFVDSGAKTFTPPGQVVCKINENAEDEIADESELNDSQTGAKVSSDGKYKIVKGKRIPNKKFRYKTNKSTSSRYKKDSENKKKGLFGRMNTSGKFLNPSLLIIICVAISMLIFTTAVMINLSINSRNKKKESKIDEDTF